MAEPLPRRADTSLSVGTEYSTRESKETAHDDPLTPTRTRPGQRRVTLSHRKLVFYDPVAFRYLEEDDSTIVIARRERLQGYELYIVEQWVCSRVHPTFVITTYTGDPSHSILVNVLAVPNDERNWSKRLRIYLDAVSAFHAREQETHLGTLMVTNLSAFPSGLTVIGVPDGDVKKHRDDFIINENLKRMGCTARAAINLQPAPPSTMSKFQHLFSISESIPMKYAVMELVRLCQTALVLYGKLNPIYADGLLCDITERAIQDWWNDIGTDFHNIEPSDGLLGPTTVAALIGLMIGAYNRMRATGVNVPKDVLDVLPMKRAVGHFQKAYKVKKTRRLDRDTLDRLHRVTAKTANSEGWAVPRAVKSTVAELSGKGGEMVMGAIGANKEKVGISEVETLDLDKLAQLVPGALMKWLWQGKPLKNRRTDIFGPRTDEGLNGRVFGTDDQGNYLWTSRIKSSAGNADDDNEDVAGHDKSGLKKLRGIPGLRSHHGRSHKHSEEQAEKDDTSVEPRTSETRASRLSRELNPSEFIVTSPSSIHGRSSSDRDQSRKPAIDLALANADAEAPPASPLLERVQTKLQGVRNRSNSGKSTRQEQLRGTNTPTPPPGSKRRSRAIAQLEELRKQIQADEYQKFSTEFDEQDPESINLRRTKSAVEVRDYEALIPHSLRLPRQMSFSLVEGSVSELSTAPNDRKQQESSDQDPGVTLQMKMSGRLVQDKELQRLVDELLYLEKDLLPFGESEVVQVEVLDDESRLHLGELNSIYYQRLDEYQSLQATSSDLVAREKASLTDGLRKVEMLGQRLDYELDALQSRMQEVEDGAAEFERNVAEIEGRVTELVHDRQGTGAEQAAEEDRDTVSWYQRAVNFFGSSSASRST